MHVHQWEGGIPLVHCKALRLALREEQRQRTTLADGLEAERAATAAAMRKVAELVSSRLPCQWEDCAQPAQCMA